MRTGVIAIAIGMVMGSSNADEVEIQEGLPEHLLFMESTHGEDNDGLDQNLAQLRTWDSGTVLRVCFFGGGDVVHHLVSRIASEWTKYANVSFDFTLGAKFRDCTSPSQGFSQIRVSFGDGGYWSAVGKDSVERLNQYQPSLNLEAFDRKYDRFNGFTKETVVSRADAKNKATILHEFGHALGLLHEHQNKNLDCWSEVIINGPNNVYEYFARPPNRWSKLKVDRNLGPALIYDPDSVGGYPDSKSIMMYLIPHEVLRNGVKNKCYIKEKNLVISELDKKWIKKYYPLNDGVSIDDLDIGSPTFATIPSNSLPSLADDYLERILADIVSNETVVRRDARVRLADLVAKASSSELVDKLVKDLGGQSYRYQLGVAAALSKAGMSELVSDAAAAELRDAMELTSDDTLGKNLQQAIQQLPQQ